MQPTAPPITSPPTLLERLKTAFQQFRVWLAHQSVVVRRTVSGGLFALYAAILSGAWFSTGDLLVISGALIFSTGIAWFGIATSTELSSRAKLLACAGALIVSGAVGYVIYTHYHPGPQQFKTLRQLFDTDFGNTFRHSADVTITDSDKKTGKELYHTTIRRTSYLDFPAKASYLGIYIPATPATGEICRYVADNAKNILDDMLKEVAVNFRGQAENRSTNLNDLTFTGRVYIYTEWELTTAQKANLEEYFQVKGLSVEFRSLDYELAANQAHQLRELSKQH